MAKKYFVDQSGRVTGECVTESPLNPLGLDICELEITGEPTEYTYIGSVLSHSPLPGAVPKFCSRRQGRLALLAAGKLDEVETIISGISDPVEQRRAQIEYDAETWERSNLFLQTMWTTLGGTSEELDALFTEAVTL